MSTRRAAFFDVDGTLTRSDIFRDHLRFRGEVRPGPATGAWLATAPLRAAWLLALDRVDRALSNRAVYRWYEGFQADELGRWAERFQEREGLDRAHPHSLQLLRRHAERGDRIVLVTGSLLEIIEPLARLLEAELGTGRSIRVEAARLEARDGRFTGALAGPPLSGAEKARRARLVAEQEGLDLEQSHAYGDSVADLELLECVGRPVALNPDGRLRRLARRRGWPVIDRAAEARLEEAS